MKLLVRVAHDVKIMSSSLHSTGSSEEAAVLWGMSLPAR